MSDLISRSALLEGKVSNAYISRFEIEQAPTVDAVEVVRCKDCKHRESVWHKDGRMKDGGYYYYYCNLDTGDPFELGREAEQDDWFCADGERKEVSE